jgi:N-acyl amino acid synthase of PEP-CTERM/exosortase system
MSMEITHRKCAVTGLTQSIARVPSAPPPEEPLLQRFERYFEVIEADTPDLVEKAHAIRYRVYCEETHFLTAAKDANGLEKDNFDAHSVHALLMHRKSGQPVGTVRLVLPLADAPTRSFSIQAVTEEPVIKNATAFPLLATAEISRFCIERQFRRRATDTLYDQEGNEPTASENPAERRSGPLMRLGLMQAIVSMSVRRGMTHWCAVMEPTLLRMLQAMGIAFTPIGPLVDYHGLRQPCTGDIAKMLDGVKRERPDFWDVITAGGVFTP